MTLHRLEREILGCERCPRLVAWRARAAADAPPRVGRSEYWSRPVPSFGPRDARIVLIGLAPGAHGANRTGRPFTGDGAGPFLYGALHRAGLASAPVSTHRDDGLELRDVRITNAVRCVPPGNRPAGEELERCGEFLRRELALLPQVRAIVCLGQIAWQAALRAWDPALLPRPKPRFGHGSEAQLGGVLLLGSYHPSQLNTRTGRLTPPMFDRVLLRALRYAESVVTVPGQTSTDSRSCIDSET